MGKWQEGQRIYWGNENCSPQLWQVGLNAALNPDGVLVKGCNPNGDDGELIIPYDVFSSLVNWGRDHSQLGYDIWSKLVTCPTCGGSPEIVNRSSVYGYCFEWECTDCHGRFKTNYKGMREDEINTPVVSGDGLGELEEHPF